VRRSGRSTNREDRDRGAEMRLTERTRKCLLIATGPGYMSGSRIYVSQPNGGPYKGRRPLAAIEQSLYIHCTCMSDVDCSVSGGGLPGLRVRDGGHTRFN